jgi:fluoride exporter
MPFGADGGRDRTGRRRSHGHYAPAPLNGDRVSEEARRPVPPRHAAGQPPRPAPSPRDLALVAAGGAIGALARVGLTEAFAGPDDGYPWVTFLENIGGAFALAFVLTLLVERLDADPGVRLFVCTGALGAFTTYSTFADEVLVRLLDGRLELAVVYATATLVAGLLAALAGIALARRWPSRTGGTAGAATDGGRR